MTDVTRILNQIEQGDPAAAEQLLPLVYKDLKRLASSKMADERPDHTLQATALVHEAYLRLVGSNNESDWDSRGHFFSAAAEAMRRILVNHARDRGTAKRGGNWNRVTLSAISAPSGVNSSELIAVDDAIAQLESLDQRAAQIAKLRIFAGLTVTEVADVLQLGRRSVDRHWAFARAWLRTHLNEEATAEEDSGDDNPPAVK